MKQELQKQIAAVLKSLFNIEKNPSDIHLEHPQDETHGDWATNIALTLSKNLKRPPHEIAEKLAEKLKSRTAEGLYSIEIAGPGFINFKSQVSSFKSVLNEILEQKTNYGDNERLKGKKIMLEFAHPNPFKSFHIGHLRNIILGESLVRLLESQGAEVIRVNYQGDVGMHIAKCLWAFKRVEEASYPETADEKTALLGKCYAQGAAAFEEDEKSQAEIKEINKLIYTKEDELVNKLWNLGKTWSLEKFHEIYSRVYTTFEREFMESETLPFVPNAIELAKSKGILKESQGALIFDGSEYGMETRVFRNSQGLPTYEGKELGLAQLKTKEYGVIDLHIHNVAVEHKSFFQVTFKVKELLWPQEFTGRQYHNAYEFVGLKKGKMSSRKGNVILGNDILNEAQNKVKAVMSARAEDLDIETVSELVGVGAIKWSFLKISPFKYLSFDMEESINFEGDSGPYIQYSYARAKSILKDTKQYNTIANMEGVLNQEQEVSLLKWLERFPEIVQTASQEYTPNYVTAYLLELSQRFNSFYKNLSVLKADNEEDKIARLMLTQAVTIVLAKGLDLLGIKTVEKM